MARFYDLYAIKGRTLYPLNGDVGNLPTISGVYAIYGTYEADHIPLYIGSSKNIKNRIVDGHRRQLKSNKHPIGLLQESYNKYPDEFFVIVLEETVNIKKVYEAREQYYLDTLKPFQKLKRGFNTAVIAGSPPSLEGKKLPPLSAEHRAKISAANKGRKRSAEAAEKTAAAIRGRKWTSAQMAAHKGVKQSEESKAKRSATLKGRKHTPESIEKMRKAHANWPGYTKGMKLSAEHIIKRTATRRFNYQLDRFWCA
jgi:group I intron endonuclease